jgi:tetratricopeptide (TPR) repeat protein
MQSPLFMSAPNSEKPEYIAFISYRHADNREPDRCWATWLHRSLETYTIPPDLVGTTNLVGNKIPSKIYPVFRDEEEFSAEASLAPAIQYALLRSKNLIVLCSPKSVQSPYVAAEIRHFKKLGRANLIIPVLLDGEPGHPTREAFPEPLREQFSANGTIREETVEPLAADFRLIDATEGYTNMAAYDRHLRSKPGIKSKDRELLVNSYRDRSQLALLKIIAAVLAVPLSTLTRRDQAHQLAIARRRARVFRSVAATLTILLALAIGTGLYANRKRIEAIKARDSANDLVSFMLTDLHDQLSQTGRLDVLSSAVEKVDQHLANNPTPPQLIADLRLQQARILFGQGKLAQAIKRAEDTLNELPQDKSTQSRRAKLHAFLGDMLAWESNGNSAAKEECLKALELFDGDDTDPSAIEAIVRTHIALGDIQRDDNEISQSLESYQAAWSLATAGAPALDDIRALAGQRTAEVCHLNNDENASFTAITNVLKLADYHLEKKPNSHPWLVIKAETLRLRSIIEEYRGKNTASITSLREAETYASQTATPGQLHRIFLLASIKAQLAAHPSPSLTIPQRVQLFTSSLETQRSLLRENPNNRGWSAKIASTLRDHAAFQMELSELFKDPSFRANALDDLKEAALLLKPIELSGTLKERIETTLALANLDHPENRQRHLSIGSELIGRMPADNIDAILLDAMLDLMAIDNKNAAQMAHEKIQRAWDKANGIRKSAVTRQLADSHLRLSHIAAEKSDVQRFLMEADRADFLLKSLRSTGDDQPDLEEKIALTISSRAKTLQILELSKEADQSYREALEIFSNLSSIYPEYAPSFREMALAEYQLGKIATTSGNQEKAIELFRSAFAHYQTFIRNAALEAPRPPSPMSFANLTTLKAIAEREALAAAALNKPEEVTTAWTKLFVICEEVDTSQIPTLEEGNFRKIHRDSLAGAIGSLSKIPKLSTSQSVLASTLIDSAEKNHGTAPPIEGLSSLKNQIGISETSK